MNHPHSIGGSEPGQVGNEAAEYKSLLGQV